MLFFEWLIVQASPLPDVFVSLLYSEIVQRDVKQKRTVVLRVLRWKRMRDVADASVDGGTTKVVIIIDRARNV